MLLDDVKKTEVCAANKILLDECKKTVAEIMNEEEFINLSAIPSREDRKVFFEQFCENEKLNAQHSKKIYQKEKYKAKYTELLLIAALTLVSAGYLLASLFIASYVILPIIPVFLAGVAIIALTKLYFNIRLNALETNKSQAQAILDKIMVDEGSNEDEANINGAANHSTKEIKETIQQASELTRDLSQKVDKLADNYQRFFSTFKTSHEHSAALDEIEKTFSPSQT